MMFYIDEEKPVILRGFESVFKDGVTRSADSAGGTKQHDGDIISQNKKGSVLQEMLSSMCHLLSSL